MASHKHTMFHIYSFGITLAVAERVMINTALGLGVTLTFFSASLSKQVELPHVVLILHHATTHCVQNCKYSILPERSPETSPGAGAPLHLKSLRLGGDAAGNCW